MVKLSTLFLMNYGAGSNLSFEKMEKNCKGINFVSRTSKNNGVVGKVKIYNNLVPNPKMTISVAVGGSVLSSFLQLEEYYVGRDVFVLKPLVEMSISQLLFYCMCIKNNKKLYSYGRQANKTLKDLIVPEISEIPEWVKDNDVKLIKNILVDKKYDNSIPLKSFLINNLFTLYSGKDTIEKLSLGSIPLVSATSKNNGVIKYVDDPIKIFSGNSITVTGNGLPGETFYQEKNFCATSDINILIPKFKMNKYIALYICTILRKEKFKFNYGRKLVDKRIKNMAIKLPVDSNNNLNLEFMESYIKKIMNE